MPFRSWLVLVVMYFLVSVTNNYALSYNIPMPLHMVFRAGSLMANMVMGMVLLGKRYKTVKYVSVIMITVGIATCTVMSATSRVSLKTGKAVFTAEGDSEKAVEEILLALEAEQTERLGELMTGICLMAVAMFMSARMGIYQEVPNTVQDIWNHLPVQFYHLAVAGGVQQAREAPEGGAVLHARPAPPRLPAARARHTQTLAGRDSRTEEPQDE